MIHVDIAALLIAEFLVHTQVRIVVLTIAALRCIDTCFGPPTHRNWGTAARDNQRHQHPWSQKRLCRAR